MSLRTALARQFSAGSAAGDDLARDLAVSLRREPRWIPPRYLYDALGTALFEAVTRLPWYTIVRAEDGLLRRHATDIFGAAGPLAEVVELGGGAGARLLALVLAGRRAPGRLDVHLVDVSAASLAAASVALGRVDGMRVVTHEATYELALDQFSRDRVPGRRRMILLLGSMLGSVDPGGAVQLLGRVRAALDPGEALLIGIDLVKSERQLLLAYDDPLGINAALTRNLIVRINRELDAAIDVSRFAHRAVWVAAAARVDRQLVSLAAQRLHIHASGLDEPLREGEVIGTTRSHKYEPSGLAALLLQARFRKRAQWIDQEHGYALTLCEAS
jgi:dimethylhistidine N-methyltransferase